MNILYTYYQNSNWRKVVKRRTLALVITETETELYLFLTNFVCKNQCLFSWTHNKCILLFWILLPRFAITKSCTISHLMTQFFFLHKLEIKTSFRMHWKVSYILIAYLREPVWWTTLVSCSLYLYFSIAHKLTGQSWFHQNRPCKTFITNVLIIFKL